MAGNRMGRVTEDIRRELMAVMRELKDPRVRSGLVSVVRVEVTNDLSFCTAYISAMEGLETAKKAVEGLTSAKGYIRGELARALRLRHVPELIFKATDSIEYGASISKLLDDLRSEKMEITLKEAARQLEEADQILVLSHENPDGDTFGSASALCHALGQIGKTVGFCCNDPVGKKYESLFEGLEEVRARGEGAFIPKFIVSVDIADPTLLGAGMQKYADRIDLCIDHHGTNRNYAKCTYVDADASATAEIIFQLVPQLGASVDRKIAACIYTGITTDTGGFRYRNTTPAAHRIAAEIIEMGVDTAEIDYRMLELMSRSRLEMERMALAGAEFFCEGKGAIITLTREMVKSSGALEEDLDGISALPRKIEGVYAGITLREKEDGSFKVSMRTNPPLSASEICREFGGGGHPGAAGCTLTVSLAEAKRVLIEKTAAHMEKKMV